MLKIKINNDTYHLPTSLEEMSLGGVLHCMQDNKVTVEGVLKHFKLLPHVDKLDKELITGALAFLAEPPRYKPCVNFSDFWTDEEYATMAVNEAPYWKYIDTCIILRQRKNDPLKLVHLANNYMKVEQIENLPYLETIRAVETVSNAFIKIHNDHCAFLDRFPAKSSTVNQAGIERFYNMWNEYTVLDNLVGGDELKKRDMEQLPTFQILKKIEYEVDKTYTQKHTDRLQKELKKANSKAKKGKKKKIWYT
ncbi:MAG: hypothetical protein ACFB0B_20770 [Thermonemataceae bacterium]